MDDDARARPFAGVVEQVADQVGEVLRFAAEAQAVGRLDDEDDAAVAVDLLEGADQLFDDRLHLRRGARRSGARRRAGAVEIEADLATHHAGLLAHLVGEPRAARIGFVDDDAERRLQRVSKVADLGARALDHGAIGLEQQIDLGGERRDVLRESRR